MLETAEQPNNFQNITQVTSTTWSRLNLFRSGSFGY